LETLGAVKNLHNHFDSTRAIIAWIKAVPIYG
jgi:hypothetical protein